MSNEDKIVYVVVGTLYLLGFLLIVAGRISSKKAERTLQKHLADLIDAKTRLREGRNRL